MTKPLDQMSTDELKALLIQMKKEVVVDNAVQHSAKILMNSLYGATSNKYFAPYFSLAVAESITSTGQAAIRFIGMKLDEYLNKLLGTKGVEYCLYQDTDSVGGDSVITVNGNRMTIADYFEHVYGKAYESGKMVIPVEGDFTLCSPDGNSIAERKINYIMAHKTKKKMYRITVRGKSVDVTEDHSVMIMRDGVLCEAKPTEIKKGDAIVSI